MHIYLIPFPPYFVPLNYVKGSTLDLDISKSPYHIYFSSWRMIIYITRFNCVQKYEIQIFQSLWTLYYIKGTYFLLPMSFQLNNLQIAMNPIFVFTPIKKAYRDSNSCNVLYLVLSFVVKNHVNLLIYFEGVVA